MRTALKWSLAPMALVAMAIAPAMAQDATSGAAVAYSYAGDAKDTAAAPPAAPADSGACACAAAPCESCNSCGCDCCPKITWDWCDSAAVKVGIGLRTSVNDLEAERGAPLPGGVSHYDFFRQDDARIYLSGQGNEYIKFTLNTEVFGIDNNAGQNPTELPPGQQSVVRLLDGIVQFELNDEFNVWMGRFLPPSDRANLCGPFYQTPYDYPFVSNYPQVFAGRDDGAAYWGQVGGGAFKWQLGVFNGTGRGFGGDPESNLTGDLMFAARVTLNLLDPEPGYYAQSSYFGDKDILALGAAVQTQTDAVGGSATVPPRNFTGYSFDLMYETKLANCGVVTFNGAYYNFDDQDTPTIVPGSTTNQQEVVAAQGTAYLLEASYLTAQEFCFGKISGHFQPFTRYQYYNYSDRADASTLGFQREQFDVGTNYVIAGYNARLTSVWENQKFQNGTELDVIRVGAQLQF